MTVLLSHVPAEYALFGTICNDLWADLFWRRVTENIWMTWIYHVYVRQFASLTLFEGGGGGFAALQWRHNGRDGVSNHQRLDC